MQSAHLFKQPTIKVWTCQLCFSIVCQTRQTPSVVSPAFFKLPASSLLVDMENSQNFVKCLLGVFRYFIGNRKSAISAPKNTPNAYKVCNSYTEGSHPYRLPVKFVQWWLPVKFKLFHVTKNIQTYGELYVKHNEKFIDLWQLTVI